MATLEISRLAKRYGAVVGLDPLDLHVGDGEFVAILGESGSGKTTLLRAIAGLETPSEGKVRIDGREMNRLDPRQRNVAMTFQNDALLPHLSVADNLRFPLKMRKSSRAETETRLTEMTSLLRLEPLLDRRPDQLSGGQRQLVSIGRSLMRKPDVLLMDEPLGHLDAPLRHRMRDEIRRIQTATAVTTLFVTHDQAEAMLLADRLVILHQGGCEYDGDPLAAYDQPPSVFVATFLGQPKINLLSMTSENESLCQWLQTLFEGGRGSEEPLLAVRPESVSLADAQDGGALQAVVEKKQHLGFETCWEFQLGEGETVRARSTERWNVKVGDAVHIRFDTSRGIWFDRQTGKRIEGAS